MPWRGPEHEGDFPTLGYQVADLIEERCVIPDRDSVGDPFVLTAEQLRFLLWHYRIDPATDDFRFRRSALVRPQKWGKGPLTAAVVCAEVDPDGPVRFAGWDANGEPVGRSWATPWVQVTAFSLDQTQNVWRALQPMIERGPLKADIPDTGMTRIHLPGGGIIQPVTSSSGSRLGQRITLAIQDETQMWGKANGMLDVSNTQLRNLAGTGGRSIETTNMPGPNDETVGNQTLRSAEKLDDLYVDCTPSPEGDFGDPDVRRRVFAVVYGDSAVERGGWVNLKRIDADAVEFIVKGDMAQAERFFGNRSVTVQQVAFNLDTFDLGARPGPAPAKGAAVTLGFDGSESNDTTALWGCDYATGRLFRVGVWEKPDNSEGWKVPHGDVLSTFDWAMSHYLVGRVLCDPRGWRTEIGEWQGAHGDELVREFPTNRWMRMQPAVDAFATDLGSLGEDGDSPHLLHDGDPVLRRHVGNCRKQQVNQAKPEAGWVVTKDGPNSPRKIDAAVAAILARWARRQLQAEGWTAKRSPAFSSAPREKTSTSDVFRPRERLKT